LGGKAEWIELRICTRLTAAKLDAVLSELVKEDKISIIPRGPQGQNQALILPKAG
jgi:ketol-acid reductoisomerase